MNTQIEQSIARKRQESIQTGVALVNLLTPSEAVYWKEKKRQAVNAKMRQSYARNRTKEIADQIRKQRTPEGKAAKLYFNTLARARRWKDSELEAALLGEKDEKGKAALVDVASIMQRLGRGRKWRTKLVAKQKVSRRHEEKGARGVGPLTASRPSGNLTAKDTPQRSSPVPLRPEEFCPPAGGAWESEPISIRQAAILKFFMMEVSTGMTKGDASELISNFFALPSRKQAWENARTLTMDNFQGTPLFDFVMEKRKLSLERLKRETLDKALSTIQERIDYQREARWERLIASPVKNRPIRDEKGKLSRWVVDWVTTRFSLRTFFSDPVPVRFRINGRETMYDPPNLGVFYSLRDIGSAELWIGEPHCVWQTLGPFDVEQLLNAYLKAHIL